MKPAALHIESGFPWPRESSAWWSFATASLGGLWAVWWRAPSSVLPAALLAASGLCLFLAGDWISSLAGKGPRGDVPQGNRDSRTGRWMLTFSAGAFAGFLALMPDADRALLILALASAGGLVALMFFMRLEMVPLDRRLATLSSLLSTTPGLLLGLMAFEGEPLRALGFWAPLALYFPASFLAVHAWVLGKGEGPLHLGLIALPLLALTMLAASAGLGWAVLLLLGYLAWLFMQLRTRLIQEKGSLPDFVRLIRMHRQQSLIHGLMAAAWIAAEWKWLN